MSNRLNSELSAAERALRHYLLGQAAAAEQEQIERRMLLEDGFLAHVELAETELLDSYVNDRLSAAERQQLERHFQYSPARHRKLRFARALRKLQAQPQPRYQPQHRPAPFSWLRLPKHPPAWVWASIMLLVLLGGSFVTWRLLSSTKANAELTKGLASLQAAYRTRRPLAARISGFAYARFPNERGAAAPTHAPAELLELTRAERYLQDAVNTNPGPAAAHALGQVYLAKRDLDRAIELFNQAAQVAPNHAALQSDLGVAWLEKGLRAPPPNPESPEFARSLEHLNRALALDAALPEALFNRALCQQALGRTQQAAVDWRNYLSHDAQSPWADEARRHLNQLEEQNR
jgi:tetratricopeptide (TPR) repeat protein